MAIHIDRNDFVKGTTTPFGLTPEFVGQIFIDTSTSPRTIYYATDINPSTGWQKLSNAGHTHEAFQIMDFKEEVIKIMDQNGIKSALQQLMGSANTWEGTFNNFTGSLRHEGIEVLSKTSKIGDLGDVDLTSHPVTDNNSVLGWTGSGWGAVKVEGVSTGTGALDFSNFVTKTEIVNNLTTSDIERPLAASQGVALLSKIENNTAPKDHVHEEYALKVHEHDGYFNKGIAETLSNGIVYENVERPLFATSTKGDTFGINLSVELEDGSFRHSIEVDGSAGGPQSLYIGGSSGVIGKELTLNFENVIIPSGKVKTASYGDSLSFPSLKIDTFESQYVSNNSNREFGLHLSNTSLVGASQIVFQHAARTNADGLLFPKSFAGNSQPTDIGQYNYMFILDDLMYTDAALASTKNYIQLAGKKIFFGGVEPGRESSPGDIWIRV